MTLGKNGRIDRGGLWLLMSSRRTRHCWRVLLHSFRGSGDRSSSHVDENATVEEEKKTKKTTKQKKATVKDRSICDEHGEKGWDEKREREEEKMGSCIKGARVLNGPISFED